MARGAGGLLLALVLAFGAVSACGGRTPLGVDEPPFDASTEPDVVADAPEDRVESREAGRDAGSDVRDAARDVVREAGKPCMSDSDCEDHVPCTRDSCDPTTKRCINDPDDIACDDGVFCNGAERCDPQIGCVSSPPPQCDDGVACTHDSCDEGRAACAHQPDDALCPLSHGCDRVLGCQARALAQDAANLYEILLPSGTVRAIGPTGATLFDIALHPNGTVYGVSSTGALFTVNTNTGATTRVGSIGVVLNALDAAPNGSLYGAGGTSVYLLNLATGSATPVARFPNGTSSSGDIAFLGNRMLATAARGGTDSLVEFDLGTGGARVVGDIGYDCVFGLAAFGPTLYGLTCQGRVLVINASTGAGTQVSTSNVFFYGATAR
jgi:hypothetical protein